MAVKGERHGHHGAFWDVAEPFLGSGRLVEGTMMGHQCLRSATGGFIATVEHETGALVVKLPKARVLELLASGDGSPFAPAGKVFSEWVAVPSFDETQWAALILESMEFVGG